jgi:uncharacterized protein DUF1801
MKSTATTPEEYVRELPAERREAITALRNVISKNIPTGFKEVMCYGMIGWVVPFDLFPAGYHCNPKMPVPFANIASQKNFISLHHLGIYSNPGLLKWFKEEFARQSKSRLDMGKGCIRFKKMEDIPFKLIGELMKKITVKDWLAFYEKALQERKASK